MAPDTALVASEAPVTALGVSVALVAAPDAAPASAPFGAALTTFLALLMVTFDERFLLDFLPALFLAAAFFVAAFLPALFLLTPFLPAPLLVAAFFVAGFLPALFLVDFEAPDFFLVDFADFLAAFLVAMFSPLY
ncbi:MAG: hypothetical protein ACRD6N_18105 [Pyrinomonadaceae bacterium]